MSTAQIANAVALKRYYRIHARIYDVTRWSFLFGRQKIIDLASEVIMPERVLEVGCGTGRNLLSLAKQFPYAQITGVDLSHDMLQVAAKKLDHFNNRINLVEKKYDIPLEDKQGVIEKYDLIIFSYALSMFNPGWEEAIKAAKAQLSDRGVIVVVDFHDSRFVSYRNWMQVNHVRMEGHLLPLIEKHFRPVKSVVNDAYAGVWQYLMFIGQKS